MFRRLLTAQPLFLDLALLLLRIGAGAFLLTHGIPKLMRFAEFSGRFPDPIGLGSTTSLSLTIMAEAFCSTLVILGAFTRLALVPLIFLMTVIPFVIHAADPFGRKELPLFYLITFVTLFLAGPGKYSLDGLMRSNK